MSIYVSPVVDLLTMLGVAATDVFSDADIQFAVPHVTTSAEQTQHGHNTRLSVAFTRASTKGTGFRDVFYDRLDASILAKADYRQLTLTESTTPAQVLTYLRKFTGAVFTTDDLVDHVAVKNASTGDITYLVEAKSTSLGWTGSFTLLTKGVANISTAFPNDQLDGFK